MNMIIHRHNVPHAAQWALTTAWIILTLFIIVLNVPILYIFWSSEQLKSPRNMYITSLIVSDLLIGFMIPVKLFVTHTDDFHMPWIKYLCHIIMVLQTFVMFLELYSVLGLTLVRHRDITMSRAHRQSRKEACICITFFWIGSILSSVRVPFAKQERDPASTVIDSETWNSCSLPPSFKPNLLSYNLVFDFLLPSATIIFLCFHARRHMYHVRCAKDPLEGAAVKRRECRVVSMVLSLVTFFVLLNVPLHCVNFLDYALETNFFLLSEVAQLFMFSTAISNIIIYVFFNRRAAAVFLAFMKLHRRSQVGIDTRDAASQMSRDMGGARSSTVRERMTLVASSLLRYNSFSSPRDLSPNRGTTTTSVNISPCQAPRCEGKPSSSLYDS